MVRAGPFLCGSLDHFDQESPVVVVRCVAPLRPLSGQFTQLTILVELELTTGRITNTRRPRTAGSFKIIQVNLGKPLFTTQSVHELYFIAMDGGTALDEVPETISRGKEAERTQGRICP
ncbi:MAG TPA: hypothetical protein VHJ19_03255 [Gammaproteobacteria bacterium]|nr:hypothetical protein [Gammaproteobacteria bacterium]